MRVFLLFILSIFLLTGCSELKPEDVDIKMLETHENPRYRFNAAAGYFFGTEAAPMDVDHALKIWNQLAEQGDKNTQCFLGYVYLKGYEADYYDIKYHKEISDTPIITTKVEPDLRKAKKWIFIASDWGCPMATYHRAHWHLDHGEREEGIKWLTQLAEDGYHAAQYDLARHAFWSDKLQAKYWLLRAGNQGFQPARDAFEQRFFHESIKWKTEYEHKMSKLSLNFNDYSVNTYLSFFIYD